jgi:thymidylate synthase
LRSIALENYHQALDQILYNGKDKLDRTGVGTRSVFGMQMRFDLRLGFPAITTKKLAWKSVVSELLWFLEGSGDERRLAEILHGTRDESKNTIWTANAEADYWKPKAAYEGDLGRVYGVQWRHWRKYAEQKDMGEAHLGGVRVAADRHEVDQIQQLIDGIKRDPGGRRHILTAWNPAELDQMALPPCHVMSQFDVTAGHLSCQLYQRSCDMFLGVPFNIASYSLLTHIIAKECGLKVGDFIWTGGDCHIYTNHFDAVREQLSRDHRALPRLFISVDKNLNNYTVDDFVLDSYNPHPAIKANMAV